MDPSKNHAIEKSARPRVRKAANRTLLVSIDMCLRWIQSLTLVGRRDPRPTLGVGPQRPLDPSARKRHPCTE